MMKKLVCLLLAVAMLAAACLIFTGCGEDKKDTQKATTAATQAATQTATQAPTAQTVTTAPVQQTTDSAQVTPTTQAATEAEGADLYGGVTGNQAAAMALDYVGAGYEVVSCEQRYLRNQEAWYVGVKALTTDSTVYYLYVNSENVVPVTEIPDRSNGQTGLWGDIDLDTAMSYARSYMGDGWNMVGSEQTYYGDVEAWMIACEAEDGTTRYLYINSNGVLYEA